MSQPIKGLLLLYMYGVMSSAYANAIEDPCAPSAFLNIVNRPTVADSACAVPNKRIVLEFGYQYLQLTHSAGHQQNFPEGVFRLGLPANNEFVVVLPNEIRQSSDPRSGSTATVVGLKHQVGYNDRWLGSVESLVTLPNGSAAFGSQGTSVALNGIVNYSINPVLNLSFMFGGTTATTASAEGGERYGSFNPDLVLAYNPIPEASVYGEVYGQSKTGPGEGSGFNADVGVLYLVQSNCEIDLAVGRRIRGDLAGFNNYIGAGFAVMI